MGRIDLNCDLGEGCGSDAELMPYISSANIACGGHAGDAATMRETVELALRHGVAVGAHPGYEDRENFGRVPYQMCFEELRTVILRQLDALGRIVDAAGATLTHVKPHGALYNQSADDRELAAAIAKIVSEWNRNLVLVGLSGSYSVEEARNAGLKAANEAFGDRRYDARGRLVSRSDSGALIAGADTAATQVLDVVRYERVRSNEGTMVRVAADTICLHGDGRDAVAMARKINTSLTEAGISIVQLNG